MRNNQGVGSRWNNNNNNNNNKNSNKNSKPTAYIYTYIYSKDDSSNKSNDALGGRLSFSLDPFSGLFGSWLKQRRE